MPKDICCICLTRTSKLFTAASKFEGSEILKCFGLTEPRKGNICEGCRRAIYRYRKDNSLVFDKLVDSKGQKHVTNKSRRIQAGNSLAKWNHESRYNFKRIPNELLQFILSLLSVKDLLSFQAISTRFYHFCLDFDKEIWLPIVKTNYPKLFGQIVDSATPVPCWKAVYFLTNSTEECVSQVEENNERFKNLLIAQNLKLRDERDQVLDECQKTLKELESLKTVSGDSPRPEQEQMFTSMVKLKLRRSQNGLIKAHSVRGRPTNLITVRSVEVGSAEGSSSTVRECSRFFEKLETICTTPENSTEQNMSKHDITKQRASLMLRDKEGYFEATRKSGVSIISKFKLDLTTALSLKKEMPLNLWKIVKRALSDSFSVDVMGTERELREGLKEHGESDYEVGEFINSAGETVTFLRATDVRSLCKNSFDALKDAKLLPNDNNVSLLICGDKGGSSTKIICQFANSEQSQSVKTAKLLGIYLGSKESRENIELAFGTIFEQPDKLTYDVFIGSSPSETPAKTENSEQVTTRESPEEFTLKLRHENKTIKSLAALLPECYNEQNNVFSIECENCMNLSRKYNWTG